MGQVKRSISQESLYIFLIVSCMFDHYFTEAGKVVEYLYAYNSAMAFCQEVNFNQEGVMESLHSTL